MLLFLAGGSTGAPVLSTESYSLDGAGETLPAAFTNAKTGVISTYRNDSSKWLLNTSLQIRYHNDPDAGLRGVLIEGQMQNKNTNVNINPTATTNLTKGGDVASVLSVVDQTALVAAANLDLLCTNGDVFFLDNALGVTDATVTIGGTTGNTNPHSLQLWAAGASSGVHGNFGLTAHATQTNITGTALTRYKQENVTPSGSGDQFVIVVPAGKGVYFIVNQLEECQACTTPIYINGAAATRLRDAISASFSALPLTESRGGVTAKVYAPMFANTFAREGFFCIVNGTGTNNSLALRRAATTRNMVEGQCISGAGTDASTNDVGGILPDRSYPVGMLWGSDGEYRPISGLRNNKVTGATMPSGFTKMWLGRTSEFNDYAAYMIFTELNLLSEAKPTLAEMVATVFGADDVAVMAEGQSNMRVYGRDETSGSNNNQGEKAIIAELDTHYPSNNCYYMDMAVSATSLDDDPSGPSWMEINGGDFQRGLYLENAIEQAQAFVDAGGRILAYCWNQGENDQGGPTLVQWKDRLKFILDEMRTVQVAPCLLIPPANRTTAAPGYETWRKAFRELAYENTYIDHAPETYWVTMDPASNNLHVASAGTVEYAPILARKVASLDGISISGGVDGIRILSATRSGTTITVTIDHDGGTDFTPTTGISGFRFYDGVSETTITGAVRTNATTITLTLAGAPSGVEKLFYGQGTISTATFADMVRDNSTYQLPMYTEEMTLPYTYVPPVGENDYFTDDAMANRYFTNDGTTDSYQHSD